MSKSSWPLSNVSVQEKLERAYKNRSIDFANPGFADSEAFLRVEREDARFLETYARYVESRTYDDAYLADARQKIDVVAEAVRSSVARDGRLGACVDASGMVARMLDRLKIWNYVAKATLTIAFNGEGLQPQYFWVLDAGSFSASHAIVVAPPFTVVDVTIKQQSYPPSKREMLPEIVLSEDFEPTTWAAEDLANPQIREALRARRIKFETFLRRTHPQILDVMGVLPPRLVRSPNATLKYVPVAVAGFTAQLEGMTGYKPCGRTALEIFEHDVLPVLSR